MADELFYKTVIGTDGNHSVNSGLSLSKIIKVSRQGDQKDYGGFVALSALNGSNWTYLSVGRRISFGTNFPFSGSETVMIIYKETI